MFETYTQRLMREEEEAVQVINLCLEFIDKQNLYDMGAVFSCSDKVAMHTFIDNICRILGYKPKNE
jgi:hypothetical protein